VNPFFFSGISINTPIRDPFGSTWPDHFSKADDGPGETTVNLLNSLTVLCPVRSPFYISHYPHSHITVYTLRYYDEFLYSTLFTDVYQGIRICVVLFCTCTCMQAVVIGLHLSVLNKETTYLLTYLLNFIIRERCLTLLPVL